MQMHTIPRLKNVRPYHAVGHHRTGAVYHDRTDCPDGKRIHSERLAAGAQNLPLCEACRALRPVEADQPR
jgi:hypothetical protein